MTRAKAWRPGLAALAGVLLLAVVGCGRAADRVSDRAVGGSVEAPVGGSSGTEPRGVVVEKLVTDSAAERAGLQVDDVLLSWHRGDAGRAQPESESSPLRDPFDYLELQEEQAPRGEFRLRALRRGRAFEVSLSGHQLGLRVRPRLGEARLEVYRGAVERLSQEADAMRPLAEAAMAGEDRRVAIWLHLRAGQALSDLGRDVEALAELERASRLAERSNEPAVQAWVEMEMANDLSLAGRTDEAIEHYGKALELRQSVYGDALCVATTLNNLGVAQQKLGDLVNAETLHRQALELRERLSPHSLEVTQSLSNLARLAARRGDLEAAEEGFLRILEARREQAPGSAELAHAYNSVGVISGMQGDRAAAAQAMQQSLELWRELEPEGRNISTVLQNLGLLAQDRGDLVAAEGHYREAMEIAAQRSANSLDAAWHLHHLAGLARQRGDLEAARRNHRRALAIREQRAPGSLDVALTLAGLADVARDAADFDEAERLLEQALEIRSQAAVESLEVARTLLKLGEIRRRQGRLDAAERDLARSAEIFAEKAPGDGFFTAVNLRSVGAVAFDRGDPKAAERALSQALAIFRRLAPGSRREALVLHQLGRVYLASGRLEEARESFQAAVDALELQAGRLGGTDETRSTFRARHLEIYRELIELLVEQGRREAAFHVLERSRARALLDLLAERDLIFDLDLPAELERRRRRVDVRYDRAQQRLAKLSPGDDAEQLDAGRQQLEELRRQRQIIRQEILRQAPGLAALQAPQPLDAAAARRALDPGTVLLAFSVGDASSTLFALTPEQLWVWTLGLGEAELRQRVERLRLLLEQPTAQLEPLVELASALYRELIGAASEVVGPADRLLVVPDGALHKLPFGALVQPGGRYLIESKPVHVVASVTVYDELRKRRRRSSTAPGAPMVVAFGDPIYPGAQAGGPGSPAVRGGDGSYAGLAPLAASRDEVQQIGRLYGDAARLLLGPEATEGRAKAVARDARVLHFAAHVVIDELFPLDSGVALSLPAGDARGRDNGLLQAWEIFEEMRLDADLVTLSACESALGKEIAGEGLMGLTRAFQYAGARSVVASLWRVADRSTAILMTRFYHHLRSGRSHDEALRRAQLDLIRQPMPFPSSPERRSFWSQLFTPSAAAPQPVDASHPYHWAAFQLFGDWQSGDT
ncbi:MAG: tetratricopeptide repeat protein [Acidobacteriota bacterium]